MRKMNWTKFETYNDAPTKAFEVLCNQLFENWCKKEYANSLSSFNIVNGAGGDGGVESYATLINGDIVGLQAKWFTRSIDASQISQIKNSIDTAMHIRPNIARYIVCVPRDLSSLTGKGVNNEQKRWDDLIKSLKSLYPNLIVDLWNETRILSELQNETSVGIYKFWFDKSEITIDTISFAFKKSKESWLSTKYMPELNTYGKINSVITSFLGNEDNRSKEKRYFENFLTLCNKFYITFEEWKIACGSSCADLLGDLDQLKDSLNIATIEISKILTWLHCENESVSRIDISLFCFYESSIIHKIDKCSAKHSYYFHFSEIEKILKQIEESDITTKINEYNKNIEKINLLFLGEPGTGKTHGVSAVVEKLLDEKLHTPILIQARDIPAEYGWKEIIINNLALSNDWSESEIWQALSSHANRIRFQKMRDNKDITVLPKVFIVVDAIDESSTHVKWIQRIQEAKAIIEKYPLIRFAFTTRPYVVNINFEDAKVIHLGVSGDTPTHLLFNDYIKKYNITIINSNWIKYTLTSPLSLKLFCDIHKDESIDQNFNTDISLSNLLKEKIACIEKEFCNQNQNVFLEKQFILRSITAITNEFYKESRIEQSLLNKTIQEALQVDSLFAEKVLNYLSKYGILRSFCEHSTGYLIPDTYYYYPGIQGYFDYAATFILLDKYKHPENIDFSIDTNINKNTLYLLSIIAIQKYNYLLNKNDTISTVADKWFCEELLFLALRNSNEKNAVEYKGNTLNLMSKNASNLIDVVNKLILPLSRNTNHPLGASLLDEYLLSFTTPAERDIVWSVPSYLNCNGTEKWCHYNEIDINDNIYKLSQGDTVNGLALIYAWSLSSLDNSKRKLYRNTLMKWALVEPEEFYKLFIKFSNINDTQIRSDMFSILTSLIFESENLDLIKKASVWVMENILCSDKIYINYNIAIRYYSCAIIKKAVIVELFTHEHVSKFLPPYAPKEDTVPLNIEALSGTRMDGYSGINYDLSRYVLIDHFTSNFQSYNGSQKNQLDNLVKNITDDMPMFKGISYEQFILSAAFAYIEQQGWNKDLFYNYDISDNKEIGVDIAISRTHYHASHGAQSNIMTICEKYVWQARHFLNGFFADRLLYVNDDTNFHLDDYGMLDDFTIPMQEINQINPNDIPITNPWHIPEKESVFLIGSYNSKNDVIKNIMNSPDIDWNKWIIVNNEDRKYKIDSDKLLALKGYSCFHSSIGIETSLFINTFIIPNEEVNSFFQTISENSDVANIIANPTDWDGGVHSSCYITPKEICWFPWKSRYESSKTEDFPMLNIKSAVDSCCYNFNEIGDVYYRLPSSHIRNMLNITNSDGYLFLDKSGEIKAQFSISGEKWRTYQDYLLVNFEELMLSLKTEEKEIVWIVREYRREDGKAKEKFGDFWAEKDSSFVGRYIDGKIVFKELVSKTEHSNNI